MSIFLKLPIVMIASAFNRISLPKLALLGLSTLAIGTDGVVGTKAQALASPNASQTLLAQTALAQNLAVSYEAATAILKIEDTLINDDQSSNNQIYDEFAFEGSTGQDIVITLQTDNHATGFALLAPNGDILEVISEVCDSNGYCSEETYSNEVFEGARFVLPQTGRYRLIVQSYTASELGGLYKLAVWDGGDAYQLLEQAELLLPEIFGLDMQSGGLRDGFSGPDPDAVAQHAALGREAFRLLQAAGDEAGQLYILSSYPQYATESTADDNFLEQAAQGLISLYGTNPNVPSPEFDFNYDDQIEASEEEINLRRELGDERGAAFAEFLLAMSYMGRGQYQQAIDNLETYRETALANITYAEEEYSVAAQVLPALASAYHFLGQYEQSNEFYREYLGLSAARTYEQLYGEAPAAASTSTTAPGGWQNQSDNPDLSLRANLAVQPVEGLDFFLQSAASIGSQHDLALVAYNYYAMGDYEAGLELTERVEDVAMEQRATYLAEPTDNNETMLLLNQAIAVQLEGGGATNQIVRAYLLSGIGRYREAIALSLKLLDQGDNLFGSGSLNVFVPLSKSYRAMGDVAAATTAYQQMLVSANQIGDRAAEAYAYSRLAEVLVDQKQPELAIAFYKKSINIRENLRLDNEELTEELQLSWVETFAEDYRNLADLLLQQDRVLEAQEVLDLLRIQELEDFLKTVRGNEQINIQLDYWEAESNILQLYAQAIQQNPEAQLNAFINRSDIQAAVQQLRRATSSQNLNPESLDKLQDNLQSVSRGALLYPLILEDRLELILVTTDDVISKTVAVDRSSLNQAILDFRQAITNPTSDAIASGQQLYEYLIRPLESELQAADIATILYAADSQLRYVPLAALHTGEQWLAQQYVVNQITAASLTDFATSRSTDFSVIAGAFSQGEFSFQIEEEELLFSGLPYAGREVEIINEDIPNSEVYFNQQFNPANVIPQMGNYGIVHFATHAAFLPGSPDNSFILFGNGDRISLREIASWDLENVDLVVLSACQTAVSGALGNGDEILGFGYQIQRTGAKAAIASLWQVNDQSTQILMNIFYDKMSQGMGKAEALQLAQQMLITDNVEANDGDQRAGVKPIPVDGSTNRLIERYSHPYYWAPFILIGHGL